MRHVAVTGVGLLTALGVGRVQVWEALVEGRSGIRRISNYDPASFRTRFAAELDDFEPTRYANRRALRMTTRNDQLAIAGAALAVADARIDFADCDTARAAVFVGGNKEVSQLEPFLHGTRAAGTTDGRADHRRLGAQAASAFAPLFYVEGLQSASLFHLSQAYGLRGTNAYFHGTADAGATAIGRGFRAIGRGEADIVLAGGFDDASSWWSMTKMDGLGVLSPRGDLGEDAFRPYDRDRSGSLVGEGAAFLVLEELEHARRRGAHVYATVSGFGSAFDGARLLTPEPDGAALSRAVANALREARVAPAEVGYVAAHGCATRLGDASESSALNTVFGAGPRPVASSVKPATGHLVAGAGALNAAVCVLAIDSGTVPPTLNLDDQDPDCDFDFVAHEARRINPRHAVSIARGLEGQQVALALSAAA